MKTSEARMMTFFGTSMERRAFEKEGIMRSRGEVLREVGSAKMGVVESL